MSDSTMVVLTPEDILPSDDAGNCVRNDHGPYPSMNPDACSETLNSASPSSSSIVTPSTSATSSPPTDNDGDKDMELIPFIDPEDVIGRRVMFDLPPLTIESEWSLPGPEPRSNKRLLHPQLPSPEDDAQSTMTNFTTLSESESQKGIQRQFSNEIGQEDLMSLSTTSFGQGAECITPLLELNSIMQDSVNHLRMMTPQSSNENTCAHPGYRNGVLSKPNLLEEELIYENYFFIHWNWPLIRCACKISLISVMIGFLCIAIGLIVTAPRTCDPSREWWQGGIVYEIFPAAFQDFDDDGIGDLVGLTRRSDYIQGLGVGAIRLNSIFASDDYPNMHWSILNLTAVASPLGTLQDFDALVTSFHARNIRVILDFNPVFLSKHHPLVSSLLRSTIFEKKRNSTAELLFPVMMSNDTFMSNLSHGFIQQEIQNAMQFWLLRGVDGFYMKYLEVLDITPQLLFNLLEWRSLMDKHESSLGRRILICSGSFFDRLENESKERAEVFMGLFDLVDYQVQFEPDLIDLMPQELDRYTIRQFGASEVPSPWILWSAGSSETPRLATRLGIDQAFAATLVQLMLPGTISLLYGDEINLEDYSDNNQTGAFIKPWAPMKWATPSGFRNSSVHPWLQKFKPGLSSNNQTSSLDILRTVIALRNSSTPLFVSSMMHRGEHGSTRIANYKVRFCNDGMLVLERFYPRWNSFVVMANLGEKSRNVDLSSTFYQGKIIVSTESKMGDVVFRNIHLKSGEAFIARL